MSGLKIVRSNKKGFRIHSPFIYELVTNVLYKDHKNIYFKETDVLQTAKQIQLNYLYRLLHYFHPEKVFFHKPLTAETERELKYMLDSDFFYSEISSDGLYDNILTFPFAVLDELIFHRLTHFPENNSVWFIEKNLYSGNSIFQNLPKCEKGRITIELKYSGIIIFNNKFYTQEYLIR
ncbi:MAG: hypothetical protein LBV47_06320 [Bacteroidales bacterium]|jgi:hypothetical protein|nr:hypothetical protein [Bacteroidales bacterium]